MKLPVLWMASLVSLGYAGVVSLGSIEEAVTCTRELWSYSCDDTLTAKHVSVGFESDLRFSNVKIEEAGKSSQSDQRIHSIVHGQDDRGWSHRDCSRRLEHSSHCIGLKLTRRGSRDAKRLPSHTLEAPMLQISWRGTAILILLLWYEVVYSTSLYGDCA